MIDTTREEVAPFAAAAKWLPSLRGGRPIAPGTLWRWARRGLKGVRLEIVMVGGIACTSREALQRFFESRTEQENWGGQPAPTEADDRHSAVESELDKLGV